MRSHDTVTLMSAVNPVQGLATVRTSDCTLLSLRGTVPPRGQPHTSACTGILGRRHGTPLGGSPGNAKEGRKEDYNVDKRLRM